ncbi:MAG TPA: hypothetical protein V6C82_07005, partial [Chroococcales cyanobacterium]
MGKNLHSLIQAIKAGSSGKAAAIAEQLTIEIRSSYDPLSKRGLAVIQAAAPLEEALRRRDSGNINRLARSFQQDALPLCRAIENLKADFNQSINTVREAIAAGDYEKASLTARSITRSAKLLQDPHLERVANFGRKAESFAAFLERKEFKGAQLILSTTLQAGEILASSLETLSLGKNLFLELQKKDRAKVSKLSQAFSQASEIFLGALRERARRLADPCEPLLEVLKKKNSSAALDHLLRLSDGIRAVVPGERELLDCLLLIHDAVEDPETSLPLAASLGKKMQVLAREASKKSKELDQKREHIVKKGRAFAFDESGLLLLEFLQADVFRALPAYRLEEIDGLASS